MYSFLYWLYFTLGYLSKFNNNKILSFFFKGSSWLCSHYFNGFMVRVYKRRRKHGITRVKRTPRVIATLTSYPARIDQVWIAVETIFGQSVKADEVILWLAASEFSEGLASLPKELLAQTKRGLTIRFCDNLRSHKKYFYTFKEYPEDLVIIFDDDMFYPENCIKTLLKLHKKAPDNIICSSSSIFHKHNLMDPIHWEQNKRKVMDAHNLGINGCSSTLYPPFALHENVFQKEVMTKLAFQADDLWLTAAAYMKGTRFTSLRYRPFPVPIKDSQKESLYFYNNFETSKVNNNTQWRAILDYYREDLKEWLLNFGITEDMEL